MNPVVNVINAEQHLKIKLLDYIDMNQNTILLQQGFGLMVPSFSGIHQGGLVTRVKIHLNDILLCDSSKNVASIILFAGKFETCFTVDALEALCMERSCKLLLHRAIHRMGF